MGHPACPFIISAEYASIIISKKKCFKNPLKIHLKMNEIGWAWNWSPNSEIYEQLL